MQPFQGMGFHIASPITNIAKAICESLLAGKKAPAARKKTSAGLLHVIEIPGTSFLPKKSACGTQEDLNRAITCYESSRNVVFAGKKAPAARKKASPGYRSQLALAIFVIGHTHIQFEL